MKKTSPFLFCLLLISFTGAWVQTRLVEKVTQKGDEIVIPYEK